MIDGWAKNEERVSQQFLTSSYETDDNTPLVARRTRRNIVRPVRDFLKTVDDGSKTEDEGELIKGSDRVRTFHFLSSHKLVVF